MKVGDPDGHGHYEVLDDDGQTVLCHECGHRYKALTSHLARMHGTTTHEYKQAHGIARTRSLTSASSRELRQEIGRRRRDTDPTVMAALTSEGALRQRAPAWPETSEKRASSVADTKATRLQIRRQEVEDAAQAGGYRDFNHLLAAAREDYQGWWWVSQKLGMSQTPLRRWAESEGHFLPSWRSQASVEALRTIRDHLRRGGSPEEIPHGAARWIIQRRWQVRRRGSRGPADLELDRLLPGWENPAR